MSKQRRHLVGVSARPTAKSVSSKVTIGIVPESCCCEQISTLDVPGARAPPSVEPGIIMAPPATTVVCVDPICVAPPLLLTQSTLDSMDSRDSAVSATVSVQLENLEGDDTDVTDEDDQLMAGSSLERQLAPVTARAVVDDYSFITGTAVVPLTLAALSVHDGSITNELKIALTPQLMDMPLFKTNELSMSAPLAQLSLAMYSWVTSMHQLPQRSPCNSMELEMPALFHPASGRTTLQGSLVHHVYAKHSFWIWQCPLTANLELCHPWHFPDGAQPCCMIPDFQFLAGYHSPGPVLLESSSCGLFPIAKFGVRLQSEKLWLYHPSYGLSFCLSIISVVQDDSSCSFLFGQQLEPWPSWENFLLVTVYHLPPPAKPPDKGNYIPAYTRVKVKWTMHIVNCFCICICLEHSGIMLGSEFSGQKEQYSTCIILMSEGAIHFGSEYFPWEIAWTWCYLGNLPYTLGSANLAIQDCGMLHSPEIWLLLYCHYKSVHFQWKIAVQRNNSFDRFLVRLNWSADVQQTDSGTKLLTDDVRRCWTPCHSLRGNIQYPELIHWSLRRNFQWSMALSLGSQISVSSLQTRLYCVILWVQRNCPAIYLEKWFRFLAVGLSGAGSANVWSGIVTVMLWPHFKLDMLSPLHFRDLGFWRYTSVDKRC